MTGVGTCSLNTLHAYLHVFVLTIKEKIAASLSVIKLVSSHHDICWKMSENCHSTTTEIPLIGPELYPCFIAFGYEEQTRA